jgi:hypothetical protein
LLLDVPEFLPLDIRRVSEHREEISMRFRHLIVSSLVVVVVLVCMPRTAHAEGFLTPYLGTTFGASFDGANPGRKLHYGAAFTGIGSSGIGFEVDFNYAPTFFKSGDDEFFSFKSDGNLVTLMGNLVFEAPRGGVRPYVSGGFGLMRSNISGPTALFDYSDSGFGVNAGAGLRTGGKVGLRAELRYFRQISDLTPFQSLELGDFHFWRGTAGVSFGF